MSLFRDIERRIDERLRRLFQPEAVAGQGRELVEIQRMILDRIDDRVQTLPRARRTFPYNDVAVRVPVPDPERREAFEMVFIADDALQEEIIEHLRREQVEFPSDLRVTVSLVETTELTEPSVVCRKREAAVVETARAAEVQALRFTLPSGEAVEVKKSRVQVGRMAEVLDDRGRLVRRNDVVIEGKTVSRAHAHIEFESGEYRLFDDGSSYGTSAIHEGRLVEVPRTGARGLRLQSGDDIYFGQARVGFEIAEP
jgi:hypothetical protein